MSVKQVNIHEAKTQLSRLVEQAVAGETIVIAKSGRPMVHLAAIVAHDQQLRKRLGFMAPAIRVPEDFDGMAGAEIEELFARSASATA